MTTIVPSAPLADLARAYGVATEYWDWQGHHVVVGAETITAVLRALSIPCESPEEVSASLLEVGLRGWRSLIPPFTLTKQSENAQVRVHVPHGSPVSVWAELEDRSGRRELRQLEHNVPPREVDGTLIGEALFELPSGSPLGWHVLYAQIPGGPVHHSSIVVVPDKLELPAAVESRGASGLMTQLYAMRSRSSWGVGDLADLADLAVWGARELGSDFVLLNPVHAAEPMSPMEPSPYLPTSRRFVNPMYIRVEEIPETAYLSPEDRAKVDGFAGSARLLNGEDAIDRDASWELKRQALHIVHSVPRPVRRQLAFEAFCEREGQGLIDFATWCALVGEYGVDGWPEGLADRSSEAVAAERIGCRIKSISTCGCSGWLTASWLGSSGRRVKLAWVSVSCRILRWVCTPRALMPGAWGRLWLAG